MGRVGHWGSGMTVLYAIALSNFLINVDTIILSFILSLVMLVYTYFISKD